MGRLLSVNAACRAMSHGKEKTVHTAVWKTPVEGRVTAREPWQARRRARDGFAYQIESYAYWRGQLGRSDFTHG